MQTKIDKYLRLSALITLSILTASCGERCNTVSGTIEVDEVHVGPRSGGRVEKIFAQEGDRLRAGQPIVELDAAELKARRDLAVAQIDSATHDAESQVALLEFLRDDAKRQQDLLKRKVISPTDAQKAASSATAQEKIVAAAQTRVIQARAQLADIDAQLAEMQVKAPSDCVLEVLSVKAGDVLAANREVATLLLPQHLWVRVYVPEPWLGLIKIGIMSASGSIPFAAKISTASSSRSIARPSLLHAMCKRSKTGFARFSVSKFVYRAARIDCARAWRPMFIFQM